MPESVALVLLLGAVGVGALSLLVVMRRPERHRRFLVVFCGSLAWRHGGSSARAARQYLVLALWSVATLTTVALMGPVLALADAAPLDSVLGVDLDLVAFGVIAAMLVLGVTAPLPRGALTFEG